MPERISTDTLKKLDGRGYVNAVKARLSDDMAWAQLTHPDLVPRTRWALTRLVNSIEEQKRRQGVTPADVVWLTGVNNLQRLARARLSALPVELGVSSANKEIKAWKAFSARLAGMVDPETLATVSAPYGGITAAEWLSARNDKKEAR
jgi:hypothetical protein